MRKKLVKKTEDIKMASKQGKKEVPQQVGMVTSPDYKPPNDNIHDFYLYVPEDKKNVSCITLHFFREYTYINNASEPIYLKPVQAHESLWTAHTEIPTDSWMSKGSYYRYKITAEGSFLYIFTRNKNYYTEIKQIHGTVHRDGTDQYLTFDGFLAHCLHVFDICNKSDIPVFRCIEQIEAMSSPAKVTPEQRHQLLEILQSRVTVFKRNSLILFTLMLNKIFGQFLSFEYSDHLHKDLIPFILETFKQENLGIYSKSCQKKLQNILLAFCRCAYGTDYCLLDFMYETYPFFDEGFFKEKIIDCVSAKKTPLCSANRKAEILTEILTVVGKRVHANDELDIKVSFLEKLFHHLPFSVALDGYCHFCKSLSLDEDKCTKLKERLLGALKANFESDISEHVHKGDFQRILKFWECVKAEQKLAELLSSKLQLDLLHMCETPKGKSFSMHDCKSLQKLVLDTHLFKDEQSQTQLLKATVSSKVKNLHELFIHFVKQENFCDYLSHDPNQLLEWIETARKHHIFVQVKHRKEVDICLCYEYLHDALAMPVVYNNGLLQEKLEKCIFECLAELDPDTVLGKYQEIERMQEHKPKIMELFIRHVRQLLHERYASYPPDGILKAICKTSNQLFINSS